MKTKKSKTKEGKQAPRQGGTTGKAEKKKDTGAIRQEFTPESRDAAPGGTVMTGAPGMEDRVQKAEAKPEVRRQRSEVRGKGQNALLYRGLEIIRNWIGHVKTPDYLELEKDLGAGDEEKPAKKAKGKKK
jgi:hypothetical protein